MELHIQNTSNLWHDFGDVPFDEWIRAIADAVAQSGLGIRRFARAIDVQPAELLAVMRLATMEEEDLKLLSSKIPPRTVWLSLADAESEELRACLAALASRPAGSSPFRTVNEVLGGDQQEKKLDAVSRISHETLTHFLTLNENDWRVLAPKVATAFKKFAKTQKSIQTGKSARPLTIPQLQYLCNILQQLADANVITDDANRTDHDMCREVLSALRG